MSKTKQKSPIVNISNKKVRTYKVQSVDIIRNFEHNSRTHTEEQIQEVVNSINEFGYTNPILVDENNVIIAGHCRIEGAKRVGMTEIPTIIIDGLTDVQKAALVIADNKLAINAGWNFAKLAEQITFLRENDYDTDLTGFNAEEILTFMPDEVPAFLGDEDDVPELPSEPITKRGDIWLLGNHRLMCGDSTEVGAVDRLLGKNKPNLMVTDPPYGVNYDPEWREGADLGVGKRSKGKVQNDDKVDWTDAYSLFTGGVAYVWHAGIYSPEVANHLRNCGFKIVSQIIWVKQHFALSRGDYHWQHEPCWYAVKKGHNHDWQGARDQATTWEIKNNNSFGNAEKEETWGHGTQKPVECMRIPIVNNSKKGDYIYDPFGGSGTTLIACEKENRKCLMMELDPRYVDVIVARWKKLTGKKEELE
jgi:DNA modification methylase